MYHYHPAPNADATLRDLSFSFNSADLQNIHKSNESERGDEVLKVNTGGYRNFL